MPPITLIIIGVSGTRTRVSPLPTEPWPLPCSNLKKPHDLYHTHFSVTIYPYAQGRLSLCINGAAAPPLILGRNKILTLGGMFACVNRNTALWRSATWRCWILLTCARQFLLWTSCLFTVMFGFACWSILDSVCCCFEKCRCRFSKLLVTCILHRVPKLAIPLVLNTYNSACSSWISTKY